MFNRKIYIILRAGFIVSVWGTQYSEEILKIQKRKIFLIVLLGFRLIWEQQPNRPVQARLNIFVGWIGAPTRTLERAWTLHAISSCALIGWRHYRTRARNLQRGGVIRIPELAGSGLDWRNLEKIPKLSKYVTYNCVERNFSFYLKPNFCLHKNKNYRIIG